MMQANDEHDSFPTVTAVVCLTAVAVACGLGLRVWAGSLEREAGGPATSAVGFAVAGAWVGSVLGLLPVSVLGPNGVMPTVWGYFAGMGLRLSIGIGAVAWAKWSGVLPVRTMVVALVATYVSLLFVEAALVGRYLWAKDFRSSRSNPSTAGPAGGTEVNL